MCKEEMRSDDTTPETSLDTVAEAHSENNKDCVEAPLSGETEETSEDQLFFTISADNDADETEPEMESLEKNNLPEEKKLIVSEDEPVEPKQNDLTVMNATLLDVWKLLKDSIAQNQDQTKAFEITQALPGTLSELKELFEKQISRNQNQIKMFDTMYHEMKAYKENFLSEALHKPIIHNLIQLYDTFASLESQFEGILNKDEVVCSEGLSQELRQFQTNLENVRCELKEALYRIDVTPYEEQLETLNRKLHKTLQVIATEDPKEDRKVAQVDKKGFYWRDKVFRPEEVKIYRYEPPKVKSEDTSDEHTLNEEGVETDE